MWVWIGEWKLTVHRKCYIYILYIWEVCCHLVIGLKWAPSRALFWSALVVRCLNGPCCLKMRMRSIVKPNMTYTVCCLDSPPSSLSLILFFNASHDKHCKKCYFCQPFQSVEGCITVQVLWWRLSTHKLCSSCINVFGTHVSGEEGTFIAAPYFLWYWLKCKCVYDF